MEDLNLDIDGVNEAPKKRKTKENVDYIKFTSECDKEFLELQKNIKIFETLINTLKKDLLPSQPQAGGNPPKYKSTGKAVYILYKKRKYKRTIYVKDKRKTKYCKINNEYILLSKLKVVE